MRVLGWFIEGFGTFLNYPKDGLPPGLTIFHGPNEAGKSTLLAFLKAMLFGQPSRRKRGVNRYEPLRGGRHFGRLFLETAEGQVTVERDFGTRDVKVFLPDGTVAGEERIREWLGQADEAMFAALYAFSLFELVSMESLDQEGVRERIYVAGSQGSGVSATQAIERLEARATAILTTRGNGTLGEVARQLTDLRGKLMRARQEAESLPGIVEAEDSAHLALEAARQELMASEERLRAVDALAQLPGVIRRLRGKEAERERLGPAPTLPEHARERLITLESARDVAVRQLRAARIEVEELDQRLGAMDRRDASLTQLAPAQQALMAEVASARRTWMDLSAAETEQELREERLHEALLVLGADWTLGRVEAFDVSPLADDRLNALGQRLEETERAERTARVVRQGKAEIFARQRILREGREADLERLAEAPETLPDPVSEQALERLRSVLLELEREARALSGEEIALMAIESAARGEGVSAGEARRAPWLPIGITLLVGGAASLALNRELALGLALAGVIALVAGWFGRGSASRSEGAAELERARLRGSVQVRIDVRSRLEAEAEELAATLGWTGFPTLSRVETIASGWRAVGKYQERREQAVREVEAARLQEEEAAKELRVAQAEEERAGSARAAAERGWDDALTRMGWEPGMSLSAVRDALGRVRTARALSRDRAALGARIGELAERWAGFEMQARAHLASIGLPTGARGERLLSQVEQAGVRIEQAMRVEATATRYTEDRASAAARQATAEQEAGEASALLGELLRAIGCADPAGARVLFDTEDRRRTLDQEIRELRARIDFTLGNGPAAEALLRELDARGEPELVLADHADARGAVTRASERLSTRIRVLHDLERKRRELESSHDVNALALEVESLEAQYREELRSWHALRLAQGIVQETQKRFERERRPAVLVRAGALFSRATGGVYPQLEVSGRELQVVDAEGGRRGTEHLSRGTAELLYICMRLGLIQEGEERAPIPVVMDDVLVNLDAERAEGAALALGEFAQTRQVLYFTCHPSTVELFQRQVPGANVVELPRFGGRPAPLGAKVDQEA